MTTYSSLFADGGGFAITHLGTVEDATDITFDSATPKDIGSPLSNVDIPANGYLVFIPRQVSVTMPAGQQNIDLGVKIGSTDYIPVSSGFNYNGGTGFMEYAKEVEAPVYAIGGGMYQHSEPAYAVLDIANLGVPTGTQTLQLRGRRDETKFTNTHVFNGSTNYATRIGVYALEKRATGGLFTHFYLDGPLMDWEDMSFNDHIVEDGTDIALGATAVDFGATVPLTIPTSGYVVLLLKQGWLYATGQAGAEFGLGISSTDYFLAEDVRFLSHYTTTGTSKFAGQGIGMMTGYQGTPQIAFFNVEKLGLPTGAQTIQVRAKQSSAGPGTIKGTSLTTKLAITTAEYR